MYSAEFVTVLYVDCYVIIDWMPTSAAPAGKSPIHKFVNFG